MTSIEFINPKSRQYYKLNKLLSTLRGFLFWKNSEGYYLGCNDNFADFVNLNSNQDIKRKTDLSFPWRSTYQLVRNHDLCVQRNRKAYCFIESTGLNNDILHVLSIKSPLTAMDGALVGTLGIALSFQEKSVNEFLQEILKITSILNICIKHELMIRLITQIMHLNSVPKGLKLENQIFDYGHVVFSYREAQCLHYFLNHYSAQKTSEKLFISPKTVEFHLAKIKEKLNCYDTYQIKQLAVDYGFIDLMFMRF